MVFTIEVKKKRKDEEFGFKDLELFHGECYGGKLEWINPGREDNLWCKRCGAPLRVEMKALEDDDIMKLVKTAIDGKERKLTEAVIVVQKSD